ncbi:MAG: hypothetical protein FJX25_00315 [Alphaproteobacteria bacterium]|nr:hypothetical protein [Alphaproteobacteria bacterium]
MTHTITHFLPEARCRIDGFVSQLGPRPDPQPPGTGLPDAGAGQSPADRPADPAADTAGSQDPDQAAAAR